jgi:hypothetical protein
MACATLAHTITHEIMLGFHISVYRQPDGGAAPATFTSPSGTRIAVWQTGLGGLDWLDQLAANSSAIGLGGNGYPIRYTATAQQILPRVLDGPPGAREHWVCDPGDIITAAWEGRTVIDHGLAAQCRPDEWLLIQAWDES